MCEYDENYLVYVLESVDDEAFETLAVEDLVIAYDQLLQRLDALTHVM